jgi:ABC-type branched-subunit amino acid transport system substrate-binding protein
MKQIARHGITQPGIRLTGARHVALIAAAAFLVACSGAKATVPTGAPTSAGPDAAPTTASVTAPVTPAASTTAGSPGTTAPTTASIGPASVEPILIGTVFVDTGGVTLADNREAMESLFAAWNEDGGIGGRPLELVAENGGLDPASASAAARKLVDEAGVVAMVLPLSPVDCQANGRYYEEQEITVLFSLSDECTPLAGTYPNGAAQSAALRLPVHYLTGERSVKRIAYVGADVPSSRSEAEAVRAQAEADGAELVLEEYVPLFGADAGSVLARIERAAADAVLLTINPVDIATFLTAAGTQGIGLGSDVIWVASPVVYDERLIATLSAPGDGLLTFTPTVPYTDPAVDEYIAIWRADDPQRPMSGTVATSWLAADVLRQLLESVDGEITRASVLAAAAEATELTSDLSPLPIPMTARDETPVAGYVIELRDGELAPVSDLIVLP